MLEEFDQPHLPTVWKGCYGRKTKSSRKTVNLLYDDLEKKNKDLDHLKKEMMKKNRSEEEIQKF